MRKIEQVLNKFKIKHPNERGCAVSSSTDLFGDNHNININWDDDILTVSKTLKTGNEEIQSWSATLDFSGRLKLISSSNIPKDLSGALGAIKYITKEISLSNTPEVIENNTTEIAYGKIKPQNFI